MGENKPHSYVQAVLASLLRHHCVKGKLGSEGCRGEGPLFSIAATQKPAAGVLPQALAITLDVGKERLGPHHATVACSLSVRLDSWVYRAHTTLSKLLASAYQGRTGFPEELIDEPPTPAQRSRRSSGQACSLVQPNSCRQRVRNKDGLRSVLKGQKELK